MAVVPGDRRWVVGLLLPILAIRAAGLVFGASDLDDCDWLIAGKLLGTGALPYVDFSEKKPLLAFLYFWPVALTGFRLWLAQLLTMVWIYATCRVVARTAREWMQDSEPASESQAELVAGCLACLALVACRPAVTAENLANLPAAAALLYFVRSVRAARETSPVHSLVHSGVLGNCLLSGVAVGLATLFKHQAGILVIPLGVSLLLWSEAGALRRITRAACLALGLALPWAVAAAAYASMGHFREFFESNVTANFAYQAHGAGSTWERLGFGLLLGIALAAPAQWLLAVMELRRRPDPILRTFLLALALTFIPVSLGGRFYDHYFIQFAPIVALCATPGALRLYRTRTMLSPGRRTLWLAGLVLPFFIFMGISYGGGVLGRLPLQEPRTRVLAAWLREHTRPDERLFVWGHFTPVYVLSERLPGTRYYNTSVHIGDFDPHHLPEDFDLGPYVSEPIVDLTLADLERSRTAIVVDTAPADIHEWHRVPLSSVPRLAQYIHDHYTLIAQPAGAAVYRRR